MFCENILLTRDLVSFADFPIAASFPHFLNGDPALVESITGLHPSEEKHGSYLIVEPVSNVLSTFPRTPNQMLIVNENIVQSTGVPVESKARSQSNLVMHPTSGFSNIDKFSNMTIPMFWAEYVSTPPPLNTFETEKDRRAS